MINASKETFENTWLGSSPLQNWIAETIVAFVLGRLPLKVAEIAFVCWKFQQKQAFQVFVALFVNSSEATFLTTLPGSSPFPN